MSNFTTQKEVMDAVGQFGELRFAVGLNSHEDHQAAVQASKEAKIIEQNFKNTYPESNFLMLVNAYQELQYLAGLTSILNEKESQAYQQQAIGTWDKIKKETVNILPKPQKNKEDERRNDSGGWNAFGTSYIGGSGCPYDWN